MKFSVTVDELLFGHLPFFSVQAEKKMNRSVETRGEEVSEIPAARKIKN